MKNKRKSISKKLRFEVFERDNFTCQYCGRKPDQDNVILHVDHTVSVKDDGPNDIANLITSCADCNCGKGAKSILKKTKTINDLQEELNLSKERLEQVKQMNKERTKIAKINKKINEYKTKWITDIINTTDDKLVIKIQTLYEKKEYSKEIIEEALQITSEKELISSKWYAYFVGVCRNLILSEEEKEILKLYSMTLFEYDRMYPAVRKIILDYSEYGLEFHQAVISNVVRLHKEKHRESYKTREEVLEYINRSSFTVYKSGINLQILVCDCIILATEDLLNT